MSSCVWGRRGGGEGDWIGQREEGRGREGREGKGGEGEEEEEWKGDELETWKCSPC